VKKAAPAKPAPAPVKAKSDLTPNGKHRTHGIMPLWLGEILVLVSYVGLGLAVTKFASQSEAALKVAGQKIKEAYEAADKLVGSKLKGSSA
jgi:phage tail tape-measure protein